MDEDKVTAIVGGLARYLRANPLACDSASGIASWWLPPDDRVAMSSLLQALEWLKQHGALEVLVGSDGRTRYRRSGDDHALNAAVAARARYALRRTG